MPLCVTLSSQGRSLARASNCLGAVGAAVREFGCVRLRSFPAGGERHVQSMSLADRQETPNSRGIQLVWPTDYEDDGEAYNPSSPSPRKPRRHYTDFEMEDEGLSPARLLLASRVMMGQRRRKRRLSKGSRPWPEEEEDDTDEDVAKAQRGSVCSGVRVFFERMGFMLLAAALWCGSVYLMLRWQRFPFHRHKVEVFIICTAPVVIYSLGILLVDRWLSCLERNKNKKR